MGFTSAGLPNAGRTTAGHYLISFDTTLSNGLALGSSLWAACEADFTLMQSWFGGIDLTVGYPIPVQIRNNSNGGSTQVIGSAASIILDALNPPGFGPGGQAAFLRSLLVAEVTELFMLALGSDWFVPGSDEGSKGEALSRFLAVQFLMANGFGSVPPAGFAVASLWLNSPRGDFVSVNPDDFTPDPTTGCTTLFLWYLRNQLGFDVPRIIAAGADTLAGVYRNLTGRSDAFAAFSDLVNGHYPPEPDFTYNPAGDNIFPVPELTEFFAPNPITTGYYDTTLIFIDRPSLAEVNIALTSDDPALVQVPPTVTIPIGELSASVLINTTLIAGLSAPRATTVHASYAGRVRSNRVMVVPPRISALSVFPIVVTSGETAHGTVFLNRAPLSGVVRVHLASGAPAFATVPGLVTVPEGQSRWEFPITIPDIPTPFAPARVSIVATSDYAASSATAVLTVTPRVVAGILRSVTLFPSTVTEGLSSRGTVTLMAAVHTTTVVSLSATDGGAALPGSGGSTIASVPATVTIPAGETTGHFTATTHGHLAAGTHRSVTIMAAAVSTRFAVLTVTA